MKAFFLLALLLIAPVIHNKITLDELDKVEGLYGVVVLKDDQTIFKKFYNEQTDTTLFNIYSETKSIMAILVGIAIDKGYIKSADQPIADFFPQLLNDTNKAKQLITIKHVMDQTSGLPVYEWPVTDWAASTNPTNFLLSKPLEYKPGTIWEYNTAATHLLSGIVSTATKMETRAFADEYLFKPLGITNYQWAKRKDGFYDGGGGFLFMRTEDMAKIGNLLVHKGKLKNQQLISEKWVNQLFTHDGKQMIAWGLKGSVYGYCCYEAKYEGQVVNFAQGYAGQFLYIIPGLKTVIAVNHDGSVPNANNQSRIFTEQYFPIIFNKVK